MPAVTPDTTIDDAFAYLKSAFPSAATFQGTHFRYAVRDGSVILEVKRFDRFFYWLLIGEHFFLIHASKESKFASMRTISANPLDPEPCVRSSLVLHRPVFIQEAPRPPERRGEHHPGPKPAWCRATLAWGFQSLLPAPAPRAGRPPPALASLLNRETAGFAG